MLIVLYWSFDVVGLPPALVYRLGYCSNQYTATSADAITAGIGGSGRSVLLIDCFYKLSG